MTTKPNLNILNEMGHDAFMHEMKQRRRQAEVKLAQAKKDLDQLQKSIEAEKPMIYSLGDVYQIVQLRDVKEGEYFRRKPTAAKEYIRDHYNRSDKTFTCTDADDIGRNLFLKADTLVCVERYL